MTTTLKRSAVYVSPFTRYACSTPDCRGYGRYGTASGHRWCGDCWRRYMLVEIMQRCYPRDLSLRGAAYQASELMQAVEWIRQTSSDEIETVCKLFHVEDVV